MPMLICTFACIVRHIEKKRRRNLSFSPSYGGTSTRISHNFNNQQGNTYSLKINFTFTFSHRTSRHNSPLCTSISQTRPYKLIAPAKKCDKARGWLRSVCGGGGGGGVGAESRKKWAKNLCSSTVQRFCRQCNFVRNVCWSPGLFCIICIRLKVSDIVFIFFNLKKKKKKKTRAQTKIFLSFVLQIHRTRAKRYGGKGGKTERGKIRKKKGWGNILKV